MTKTQIKLDEASFKSNFVAQFLATWCANNYTEYCMRGLQKELGKPPVEDAEFLAEAAWIEWCSIFENP